MVNLAQTLVDTAAARQTKPAVIHEQTTMSYRDLDTASAHVAGLLATRGVQPGDRVGLMLPNSPHFVVIYYGILRAGAVVVPMNILLKPREINYYLSDSGAHTVFAWFECASAASAGAEAVGADVISVEPASFGQLLNAVRPMAELVARDDQDTAVVLYTSGTTGRPKGAELTHGNMTRNAEVCARTLFHLTSDDVILGALPFFHVFGQTCAMNTSVLSGAQLVTLSRFTPPAALSVLQDRRVTIFMGVPTMFSALLHHPDRESYDTSALRLCVSGGAAMPGEVLRTFDSAFDTTILEGYGLSETSPVASFNHPELPRKPGSIGTPIEGVEMRLVDESGATVTGDGIGEIAIRGHNVMKGYWHRPEDTAAVLRDGWLRTGDMARVDEDGYFFIVDRKKDMIIRAGYNVYPREIEEVLYEHPDVAEAAVIGVPDLQLGEEVAAAVVLKPGADVTTDELREYVKAQVAAYKYPRLVWLADTLPKGPTGKILKREVVVPAST